MKKNKPFSTAVKMAGDKNIKLRTPASLAWFRQYVKNNLGHINHYSDIRDTNETLKSFKIGYGGIYTFMYDPKHKDTLPYYDITPMVIPFRDDGDSFLAFNLHYVDLRIRARIMDHLYSINNMPALTNTKNASRYAYFKEMGESPMFAPCIKRYLKKNVRSRFLEFKPEHWEIAVFLPTANFRKGAMGDVHSDSRRKITKATRR